MTVIAICGLSFVALAENKENKTEAAIVTEAKAETPLQTYYVTGETSAGGQNYYFVSDSNPGCPDDGLKPCEVLSSQMKDGQNRIPTQAVEEVITHRP